MNSTIKLALIKVKVEKIISYCKKSKNMKRIIQLIESELEQLEHQHHLNIYMIRKKRMRE